MIKSNFQKKLFRYYSFVMLCIILIIMIPFTIYIYQNDRTKNKNNLKELCGKTATELEHLFSDMDKIALYASTNPNVRSAMHKAFLSSYPFDKLERNIIPILVAITVPNSASKYRINLFNERGNFISTGQSYSKSIVDSWILTPEYKQWYQTLPIKNNHSFISSFEEDIFSNSGAKYITLYRQIFDTDNITQTSGIVSIQCGYTDIDNILNFQHVDGVNSWLFNENNKLIYSNSNNTYESFPKYAMASYNVGEWTIVLTQTQSSNIAFQIISIMIVICILLICITLYIIYVISTRTTAPLRMLTTSVRNVTINNLSLEFYNDDTFDEVTQLNHAFDDMIQRLKDSMEELMKHKTHEIHAHMIALQSQMDPHFLYNVLTIMKAMSRSGSSQNIGKVCDYLASMLRYITTYNDNEVTLKSEFEHTEHYLKLMKIRYEEMFEYSFEIDYGIDIESIYVPRLFLQPIIENCFQHGFQQVLPPWIIKIHCYWKKGFWYLSIEDNGSGITEKEVAVLYEKIDDFLANPAENIAQLKLGGMGLINTIARFKLKYKETIMFTIGSNITGGTIVTIGGIQGHEYSIS